MVEFFWAMLILGSLGWLIGHGTRIERKLDKLLAILGESKEEFGNEDGEG